MLLSALALLAVGYLALACYRPGVASYQPEQLPLFRNAIEVGIYKVTGDPMFPSETKYTAFPNVRLDETQWFIGHRVPVAKLHYVTQDSEADRFRSPTWWHDIIDYKSKGPRIFQQEDRIVAITRRASGQLAFLFDGFVQLPEGSASGETHSVQFQALGAPVRCWDRPLPGAVYHDVELLAPTFGKFIQTSLPIRFNPDDKPNMSVISEDDKYPNDGRGYPADQFLIPGFLDPLCKYPGAPGAVVDKWTLGPAVRYLLALGNWRQEFVQMPSFKSLDDFFQIKLPKNDGGFFDPGDDASFDVVKVPLGDNIHQGPWPEAISALIEPFGFKMSWVLSTYVSGFDDTPAPRWTIVFHNQNDNLHPKDLYLQPADGVPLNPGLSNLAEVQSARDGAQIINAYVVAAKPTIIEASFVLFPGFPINAADEAAKDTFKNANTTRGTDRDPYRVWVVDECGEGHYNFATASFVTGGDPPNFTDLGEDWVRRRRRPISKMLSKDDHGTALKHSLYVLVDYAGTAPGVWDNTGTPYLVDGIYSLLDDRLGVRLGGPDPNEWHFGKFPKVNDDRINHGVLRQIELLAPGLAAKRFHLLLNCCIESDQSVQAFADRRACSPSPFAIRRRIDAREKFSKTLIHTSSLENSDGKVIETVNGLADANIFAKSRRETTQGGLFAGSATIPRITRAYKIGDKIRKLVGRGMSFQGRIGTEAGEQPSYPTVVHITCRFTDGNKTVLQYTDQRAHREAI